MQVAEASHCEQLWARTQAQSEQQQAEAAQVQRRLLVDLGHCVQRDGEQQRRPRKTWTTQEGEQDGTQHEVAAVCNACPHGRQTQTCEHNKQEGSSR